MPAKEFHKSAVRRYHEQFIYWTSIGWDVLHLGSSSSIYVLGYIKSGTNWLTHLLSGVLGLPILEPWKLNLPRRGPCIYHMHRFIPLESVRKRTIYLMRDGRDTIVSAYFHAVREGSKFKKQVENYIGHPLTFANIGDDLPGFIRFMEVSRMHTVDYRSHIQQWKRHKTQYVTLRYEDLLTDTANELVRVISEVTGNQPDVDLVNKVVKQHDFEALTKRAKGVEGKNEFVRKGISGDWKNYFSPEAARVFDAYAGNLLVELGYETDPDWVTNFCNTAILTKRQPRS